MMELSLSSLVNADGNHCAIDVGRSWIAEPTVVQMVIDSISGNGDGTTHLMLSLGYELHRTSVKVISYSAERLLREATPDAIVE